MVRTRSLQDAEVQVDLGFTGHCLEGKNLMATQTDLQCGHDFGVQVDFQVGQDFEVQVELGSQNDDAAPIVGGPSRRTLKRRERKKTVEKNWGEIRKGFREV